MAIKKVLILAANPLETARLRLEKEVEEIRVTLERSPNRGNFAIESRGAVRPQDLQTYLYNLKPQILHFSGHGGGDWGGVGVLAGVRGRSRLGVVRGLLRDEFAENQ